jgi:hypothetical protein
MAHRRSMSAGIHRICRGPLQSAAVAQSGEPVPVPIGPKRLENERECLAFRLREKMRSDAANRLEDEPSMKT